MIFHFRDRTVTRSFRVALGLAFPGLGTDRARWRMLCHLLFGTFKNEDGELMLAREVLASIEGKTPDNHYVGGDFLNDFAAHVTPIEINQYRFWDGDSGTSRVRTLKNIVLPKHIEALLRAERTSTGVDRVYMSTGTTYLRKHACAARKEDREEAKRRALDKYIAPQTQIVLDYMNSLPPNRFTSALRHLPAAISVAETLSDRDNQLNLLAAIREHAQPFYIPSDKTTRIFAIGASINGLHRDVRAVLSQDWMTADLASAQLAIVAKVWGIPSLNAYLASGKKIWPELTAQIGLPFDAGSKQIVKDTLYAAIYGAGETRLISDLAHALRDMPLSGEQAWRDFKGHPVIMTLLKARTKQLSKIRKAKGGIDAFGHFLPLEKYSVEGNQFDYDNSRSILACIAQSYELRLLLPIAELALSERFQSHGFTICQWIHDGLTFDAHDKADLCDWMTRLSILVTGQADSLGIVTQLEFSSFHGEEKCLSGAGVSFRFVLFPQERFRVPIQCVWLRF